MPCIPSRLLDHCPLSLTTLDDSVLLQVSLAAQAKGPKLHGRQEKAQVTRLEDIPDEVILSLIHRHFGARDSCSLSQVSSKYSNLAVSVSPVVEMIETALHNRLALLYNVLRDRSLLIPTGNYCTSKFLVKPITSPGKQRNSQSLGRNSSDARRCRTSRRNHGVQCIANTVARCVCARLLALSERASLLTQASALQCGHIWVMLHRLTPCEYELTAVLQRITAEQENAHTTGGLLFLLDGSGSVSPGQQQQAHG